jgi:phospholipid transport system substrate-binding protein
MNYKNTYKYLLVVLFFTFLPVAKSISVELAAPQIVIKNASEQLKSRMQDDNFVKDFGKIRQYVDEVIFPAVNFNKISQSVLGPLWKQATADQKVRFKKEFKTLLIRVYARAFVEFDEWSIRYLPLREKAESVKKVTVRTQVLQPGVKPIGID